MRSTTHPLASPSRTSAPRALPVAIVLLLAASLVSLALPATTRGAPAAAQSPPSSAQAAPSESPSGTGWRWPVEGEVLTPYRNGDDPYAAGQHRGIDVAAPIGAPVVAAAGGTVTFAGVAGSSGLTVAIRTEDGRFDTSYLHLSSTSVRAGADVRVGDRIGSVGRSGRPSVAAPHLHFGVREAGERHAYVDPLDLLPPLAAPEPEPRARPLPLPAPDPAVPVGAPLAAPSLAPLPTLTPLPTLAPGLEPAPAPSLAPALPLTPAPRPAAAPRLAPAPRLARAPSHGTTRRSAGAPGLAPASRLAPTHAPAPRLGPAPRATPVHPSQLHAAHRPVSHDLGDAPGAAPRRGAPGSRAASAGDRPAPPRTAAAANGRPRSGRDVDVGWLAACVGLVATAALLARPRGPAGALRGGRRLGDVGRSAAGASATRQ
ncbi:MAG TPA: M23 family metallopeptidase [Thermoleophilaceae bacterium]|jgi:hypothetical protein